MDRGDILSLKLLKPSLTRHNSWSFLREYAVWCVFVIQRGKGIWLWPIYLHYKHHLLEGWPVFLTTKKCCITETNKEHWHLTIGKLLFVRTILLSSDLHPRKRRVHFPYKVWPSFSVSKLHMPGPELLDLVPHSRVSLDPVAPTSSQKTSWRLLGNYIKLRCMPRKWLLTPSWEMMIAVQLYNLRQNQCVTLIGLGIRCLN